MFIVFCCLTASPNSNNGAPSFWRHIEEKKERKEPAALLVALPNQLVPWRRKKKSQWCAVQMINYCLQHRNINCFRFSLTWCESLHLSQWSIHVFENSCFSLMAMNPPIQTVYCIYSLAQFKTLTWLSACSEWAGDIHGWWWKKAKCAVLVLFQ